MLVTIVLGHGNLSPKTSGGKIGTMLYALIGVPLMLMCLSNLGSLLADGLQGAYIRLCRRRRLNRESGLRHKSNQVNILRSFYKFDKRLKKMTVKSNIISQTRSEFRDSIHLELTYRKCMSKPFMVE